jgi:uncharacterized protein with HEPN domain
LSVDRTADHLEHIQQATADACSFVEGLTKADFLGDRRTQQAVIMCGVIIGEAATKIMDSAADFVQAHPEVPWQSMRGIRNRMVHGYFDINLDVVWDTVQQDLPLLKQQVEALLFNRRKVQARNQE